MSKKFDAKKEFRETLNKSQKTLLARIETFRLQIKDIRERELSKSLIPVHEHKVGSSVSSGVEDVPYGKLNPKGTDKSMGKNADVGYPNMGPAGVPAMKAEKCMKCGEMHESIKKCGYMTKGKIPDGKAPPATPEQKEKAASATKIQALADARKSELVDEKGNRKSNSVNTPMPEPKKQTGDKSGVVLPGAKLKKALTAGMGSGAPSTKVNELGKTSELDKAHISPSLKFGVSKPAGPVAQPKEVSTADHAADKKAAGLGKTMPAGLKPAKAPSVAMAGNNGPHDAGRPLPKSEEDKLKQFNDPKALAARLMGPTTTIQSGGIKATIPAAKKAEPPMAKPPSGKNMATNVPMSKGMFADAANNADPMHASFMASKKPAGATPKVKLPGQAAQAQRASNFGSAMAGDFAPKGPVSSGLELDTKPKAKVPGMGLASPKQAGVTPPKLPGAAPKAAGIFGKLLGKSPKKQP